MNTCDTAEAKLVHRLKERDPQAMTELYEGFMGLVGRTILRTIADDSVTDDLAQETFVRVWNGIKGFDETRGMLISWIAAVARNTAIDYLRSSAASKARSTVAFVDLDHAGRFSTPGDPVNKLHHARLLGQAFQKLSDSQRQVINLRYFEGMSQLEIAEHLDRPLGTVKTWVRTALRDLRSHYLRHGYGADGLCTAR